MRQLTSVSVGVDCPSNNVFIREAEGHGVPIEAVYSGLLNRVKNQLNEEGSKDYSHVIMLFPENCSSTSMIKIWADDLDPDKVGSMRDAFMEAYDAVLIGHFENL